MEYLNKLKNKLIEEGLLDSYVQKCLTYAKQLKSNNMIVIFDVQHLALLMGVKYTTLFYYILHNENFYNEFNISKSSGNKRLINAPSLNLKKIQKWILDNILSEFQLSEVATGFRKNLNILENAKKHTNKNLVYNIDIENFFPSIKFNDVYYIFYNVGYSAEVAYALSALLTYKECLPQGSPASPYISNIICYKMDESLKQVAYDFNGEYTRYADDMTFSTDNIPELLRKKSVIKKIVNFYNFKLNDSKERSQFQNQTQMVTGLIVNKEVKVRRKFKKDIEKHIYYCEKFGVYNHLKKIGMEEKAFYKEYIYGKAYFVKSVEPLVGNHFIKRLDALNWSY